MTGTPRRARGLIDADTGELLAVTQQGISWLRADGSRVDVTPDHLWDCVAAGGGAVAVAGPEAVQWHGPDGSVLTAAAPAEPTYRVAVAGRVVAGAGAAGRVTVWRSMDAEPLSVGLDVEPDGIAVDAGQSRVSVWGWNAGGTAAMTVLEYGDRSLTVVEPSTPWPPPDSGVAVGLADGMIAVGGSDSVTVLSKGGERRGYTELPGLERVTGSRSGLAWIRSFGDDEIVVGVGRLLDHAGGVAVRIVAEFPVPDTTTDPFPEFAATFDGELVLAAGVGPHALAVHRLSETGWATPRLVDLPDREPPS